MNNLVEDNNEIIVNYQNRMTSAESAKYLGISPHTLNIWRSKKSFEIAYFKVGRRVYYDKSDLDLFLLSRRNASSLINLNKLSK